MSARKKASLFQPADAALAGRAAAGEAAAAGGGAGLRPAAAPAAGVQFPASGSAAAETAPAPGEGLRPVRDPVADNLAFYRARVDTLTKNGWLEGQRRAWQFFHDRPWEELRPDPRFGLYGPPFVNFIKADVIYKLTAVAQNSVRIVFLPEAGLPDAFYDTASVVCDRLTAYADSLWESMKLDSLRWNAVRDAIVSGDGLLYFYRDAAQPLPGQPLGRLCAVPLDAACLLVDDECCEQLQSQQRIAVCSRRPVEALRREARRNGLTPAEADRIRPDSETALQPGNPASRAASAVENDGKALHILSFERDAAGLVWMTATAGGAVIQPRVCTGLSLYPIAGMCWERVKNSARGGGVVQPQIPNQVEYNKTLARRVLKVMETAYPKVVYNEARVDNPEELDEPAAKIAVNGDGQPVRSMIDYLAPAQISPDAAAVSSELVELTQRMSGASEAAMGVVNPENASGRAILAVQDAAARVLSLQVQQHNQFIEDIARIMLDFWRAPTGDDPTAARVLYFNDVTTGRPEKLLLPQSVLDALAVRVKVEVSPASAFSLLASEQTLENYLKEGYISFEELVEALPENSVAPKTALRRILQQRGS